MLLQRVITALVLGPLIILAIIKLPQEYFALLWGCFIVLGAWEWTNLANLQHTVKRVFYIIAIILSMLFFFYWKLILEAIAVQFERGEWLQWSGIMDWWALPILLFWFYIGFRMKNNPEKLLKAEWGTPTVLWIGWGVLVLAWMFLQRLGAFWEWQMVLYFLLLVWIADIAAYFCGRKFGKQKLLEEISPGKTVAGLYGGIIFGLLFALGSALYFEYTPQAILDFTFLSLITIVFSVNGDLFISLLKRVRGIKDSGSILPGHGGILDRIDGLLAAAPIFYIGLVFLHRKFVG